MSLKLRLQLSSALPFSEYSWQGSDFTAMFEDSDVTSLFVGRDGSGGNPSPGETVGLQLDKSHMGGMTAAAYIASWPELYDHDTAFLFNATGAKNGPGFDVTATALNAQINMPLTLTEGDYYRVEVAWSGNDEGRTINVWVRGTFAPVGNASSGAEVVILPAGSSADQVLLFVTGQAGDTTYLEITSIKHIPGQHRRASADNERPVLDRRPVSGRRNLLTGTDTYPDSAWTRSLVNKTQEGDWTRFTSNNNGSFARRVQSVTLTSGQTYTFQEKYKAGSTDFVHGTIEHSASHTLRFFADLSSGAATTRLDAGGPFADTINITEYAAGEYLLTLTFTAPSTASYSVFAGPSRAYEGVTTDLGDSILTKEPQLELASTATPYQRVTNDNDITETGVRSVYSLDYDGVDDGMSFDFEGGAGPADCSVFFAVKVDDPENFNLFSEPGVGRRMFLALQSSSSIDASLNAGTPEHIVDNVNLGTTPTRGEIYTALNKGVWVLGEARGADLSDWNGLFVGDYDFTGGFNVAGNIIGPIIVETSKLTNSLRRSIETYLKRKAGIL
jgi:hypothetical protein